MTRSIPIIKNNRSLSNESAEIQDRNNEMMVDYKDYLFYSRVVGGIRRVQGHTRDIARRYENQALIDHIVQTRHCPTTSHHHRRSKHHQQQQDLSPTSIRNYGAVEEHHHDTPSHGQVRRVRSRADLHHQAMDFESIQDDSLNTDFEEDLIFDMDL